MNSELKEEMQKVGYLKTVTGDEIETNEITYATEPFSPWVKHTSLEKAFF